MAGLAAAALFSLTACGGDDTAPDVLAIEKDAREAAIEVAKASMTYNFATLDADFDWVEDLATKKFRDNFDEASAPVRQAVEELELDARANVLESAADYEDAGSVEVLLFVDQTLTTPKDAKPTLEQLRVKMGMELVDGDWLVDTVEVVNRSTGEGTPD